MNISNFIDCRISDLKMMYLREIIRRNVHYHNVVVDIGCGKTKLDYVTYDTLYRIDPTMEVETKYDMQGTWIDAVIRMRTTNVDCVFLMDVIEHLSKSQASDLLQLTELYSKQIVVFTPLGFMTQEDGVWNTHKSGWFQHDFKDRWTSWVIPNFHVIDFKGNKLDKPVDGLLAIYTK